MTKVQMLIGVIFAAIYIILLPALFPSIYEIDTTLFILIILFGSVMAGIVGIVVAYLLLAYHRR